MPQTPTTPWGLVSGMKRKTLFGKVPVPLPAGRGPSVRRDALFLDLRDHVQEILVDQVRL